MSELVDFLAARLDEDEQTAHDADGARLFALSQSGHIVINDAGYLQHFTRDRALREVEVKRRIIAAHTPDDTAPNECPMCVENEHGYPEGMETAPCWTLRLLATAYADHEDYRPEWAA